MSLSRIPRTLAAGALAVAITGVGLAGTTTPAEAAAKTSEHCKITAVWSIAVTTKLSKNVSLTYRGTVIGKTTLYCLTAKRKKVAKKSYLSLAFNRHPGKYTSGKSVKRLLTIQHGETGTAVVRLFTKKNKVTKTYWTSEERRFG